MNDDDLSTEPLIRVVCAAIQNSPEARKRMNTKGIRKDNPSGHLPNNGDYGRDPCGDWFGMTPNGALSNLKNHNVTEHEDGTITVSPSILVMDSKGREIWHGFLNRGEWRSE